MNDGRIRLKFLITNIGNSVATSIRITDTNYKKLENSNIVHSNENKNLKEYILPDELCVAYIIINNTELNGKNKEIKYYLCFENHIGSKYYQLIKIKKVYPFLDEIIVNFEGKLNIIK